MFVTLMPPRHESHARFSAFALCLPVAYKGGQQRFRDTYKNFPLVSYAGRGAP